LTLPREERVERKDVHVFDLVEKHFWVAALKGQLWSKAGSGQEARKGKS